MPKSRKRSTRKQPRRRPGPAELQRWIPYMRKVDAAEARGDAVEALRLMMDRFEGPDGEPFWRPWRLTWVMQLAMLRDQLPAWATSRWILEQAVQDVDPLRHGAAHEAMRVAIEVRGGEQNLRGMDADDARVKVIDHDWVFRQHFLYETGGLEHFLAKTATPDLVAAADRIDEWAQTPMSGFRFLERTPTTTRWEHLGTGEHHEIANIGSASLLLSGECAIGRLVPIEGGRMFETVPLRVPQATAVAVASDPRTWVAELTAARRDRPGSVCPGAHRFGVLSDVSFLVSLATVYDDEVRKTPGEDAFAHGFLRAARRELDAPALRDEDVDVWPCLAAEILSPSVLIVLPGLIEPGDAPMLDALASRLAEPAAAVCRALAETAEDAA